MSNRISTGIELTGEKEYKSAISSIVGDMKVLSSEAKLVTEQYKDNDKSLEALTAQTENYEKQADKQRQKIDVIKDALKNAEEQYGANSKQVKSWTEQLNKAETDLLKTERAINKNNDEISKMTSIVGKVKGAFDGWKSHIDGLKEKHETLYKGMKKVGDVAGSLAKGGLKALGVAGAGAVAGVAAIGAAAIKAGKELGKMMQQAAEAGDTIDDESQKIGVSAEKYQVLSYQAELSGTSIQTISKAAAKLKSAGSDMNVDEAIQKLAAIQDPAERSAAAIEMFGAKTAQELTPMLNQGTEGLKAMEEAARENGMIMSNDAVAAASNFNDALATMKDTASAVKNNLVAELLPGATEAIEGITGLFSGDAGAPEKIKHGVESMIGAFKEMLPKAIEIIKTLAGAVLEVAPDIIIALADGIIDNLGVIVDAAIEIIQELTQGLLTTENIQKIMTAAIELVNSLVGFIAENVDLLIDSAFLIIDELVSGLADPEAMEELVGSTLLIIEKIATGLLDNLPDLLVAAFELAKALADAIIHYDWWSLAKKIFKSIKDSIKKLLTGEKDENSAPETAPKTQNRHKTGLEYVPFDGYTAELHKGERVLTAYEAQTYSSGGTEKTTDEVRALRQELAAMRDDIRRYGVPVDVRNTTQLGKQVGKAVRA